MHSPSPWPHINPRPVSKLPPPPALSPALRTGKGLPCPGCADKYGNSIFIGGINICLYIHFKHHGAGPEGSAKGGGPSSTDSSPFPQSPTRSVQTKANSSCSLFLPGEVTVWGGVRGQRGRRQEGLLGEDK